MHYKFDSNHVFINTNILAGFSRSVHVSCRRQKENISRIVVSFLVTTSTFVIDFSFFIIFIKGRRKSQRWNMILHFITHSLLFFSTFHSCLLCSPSSYLTHKPPSQNSSTHTHKWLLPLLYSSSSSLSSSPSSPPSNYLSLLSPTTQTNHPTTTLTSLSAVSPIPPSPEPNSSNNPPPSNPTKIPSSPPPPPP